MYGLCVLGDERERFLACLCADPAGKGSITAGDFNCEPEPYQGTRVLFRVEKTFRWNPGRPEWTSKLDGFMVPNILSLNAEVIALDPVVGAQHRPVILCLNQKFGEHDVVKWCKHPVCPAQPWSEKSKEEFKCAMDNDDVDKAWKSWANAAGVTVPYAENQKLQAGWTCGASHREVRRLWKRIRQIQSRGTAHADRLLKMSSRCSVI